MDVPNERSSHIVPTPRTGGNAILLAIIIAAATAAIRPGNVLALLLALAVAMGIVGLIDDMRQLPSGPRFIVQVILAAGAALAGGFAVQHLELPMFGAVPLAFLAPVFAVVWAVALTNGFNFMDGINGIASAQAIVSGVTLSVVLLRNGDLPTAIIAAAIAGAAAGFLPWNFPGGSIFMGDVGSASLGFLLAFLVLRAAQAEGFIPVVLPLLPFLLDTGSTLVIRVSKGERLFAAHRSHFYQRLVRAGYSHTAVTVLWTVLASLGSAVTLAFPSLSEPHRALAIVSLLFLHMAIATGILFLQRASERREETRPVPQ